MKGTRRLKNGKACHRQDKQRIGACKLLIDPTKSKFTSTSSVRRKARMTPKALQPRCLIEHVRQPCFCLRHCEDQEELKKKIFEFVSHLHHHHCLADFQEMIAKAKAAAAGAKAAAAAAQEAATTVVAAAATSGVVQKATASASGSVMQFASHRQSVRQRRARHFFCLSLLLSQTHHTHTLQVSRLCSRTCRGHSCRETRGLRGDRHHSLDTSSGLRE
jgi:hypothetical protein